MSMSVLVEENGLGWRWALLPKAPHSYGDTSWKVCSSHNGFHGNAISLGEEQKSFRASNTEERPVWLTEHGL